MDALTAAAIHELQPLVGTARACAVVGRPRATYYRYRRHRPPALPAPRRRPEQVEQSPHQSQPRALTPAERAEVRAVLHSERFADQAPASVYATLLDEERYVCSVSTMYRVLRAEGEVRERRRLATHPAASKPELLATRPNEVWSWDITRLLGPAKWTYYYLYVIIDIHSRYVPGWLLATRETAALAEQLLAETTAKHHIVADQLTVHADRGTSMASKPVALLLADLGVTKTHSRPHCSNDNPYSEAHFKTLKYRPDFPDRFGSIEDARAFCRRFFDWYDHEHRHSGIGFHTPADVHFGRAATLRQQRASVLQAAYVTHPERFVRGVPTPPPLPGPAWINPPPPPQEVSPLQ